MSPDTLLEKLEQYESELSAIASRFVRSRDALHIGDGDEERLHQMVIELRDLLHDAFGSNTYSSMIVAAFNEGQNNFIGSPSKHSVSQIKTIVSSVITRVKSNPDVLLGASSSPPVGVPVPEPLTLPERVSLHWLHKNVPYHFWLSGAALLLGSFSLGATLAVKVPWLRDFLGLGCP